MKKLRGYTGRAGIQTCTSDYRWNQSTMEPSIFVCASYKLLFTLIKILNPSTLAGSQFWSVTAIPKHVSVQCAASMLCTITPLGSIPKALATVLRAASAAGESVTLGRVGDGVNVGAGRVGVGVAVGGGVVAVGVAVALIARIDGTSQKAFALAGRRFARTPSVKRTLCPFKDERSRLIRVILPS